MAFSATRSSFVPAGTATVWVPAGTTSRSVALAWTTVVRGSPACGTPPHVVWPRSAPLSASIHARYGAMLESNVKSPGRQLSLRPPDAMPATTVPKPESTKRGPPESPLHELAPEPVKFQQIDISPEMPFVQGAVVIAPARLTPTSVALPPLWPKPTSVPVPPGAGRVSDSGAG